MPRRQFLEDRVLSFDATPSVVLVCGDIDFFVEEAATKVAERLAREGAEVLRFDDDAPAEAVTDALLNRALFSARRVVRLDVTRLLGSESPAVLLDGALQTWAGGAGGRREAFRKTRALLSALSVQRSGDPAELAETIAKRVRRREDAAALAEILRELPEERTTAPPLAPALRLLLERGNDGVVALLTAISPPKTADLFGEIEQKALVLERTIGKDELPQALARYARVRAGEREVTIEPDAIPRLIFQTDGKADLFAAELSKLLEWAGNGGRIRAADVKANVEDESSEDLYLFFDAIGRRDAGEALGRLERLFSGRDVRMGDRLIDSDQAYWPVTFFGMLTSELRRMLLLRAVLDGAGARWDPAMPSGAFQAVVLPLLEETVAPFGRSPFESAQGKISAFLWYRVAQRSARYQTRELAAALARAADVDGKLKSSVPPLAAVTAYVGQLIAGDR